MSLSRRNAHRYIERLKYMYIWMVTHIPYKTRIAYANWKICHFTANDNYAMPMRLAASVFWFWLWFWSNISLSPSLYVRVHLLYTGLSISCTWNSLSTWFVRMNSNMRCSPTIARVPEPVHLSPWFYIHREDSKRICRFSFFFATQISFGNI